MSMKLVAQEAHLAVADRPNGGATLSGAGWHRRFGPALWSGPISHAPVSRRRIWRWFAAPLLLAAGLTGCGGGKQTALPTTTSARTTSTTFRPTTSRHRTISPPVQRVTATTGRVVAPSTTSPTVPPKTNATVMGGGNPSTWPAAKPNPPSLAGAYSTNLKIVVTTLFNYLDWIGSHPNPSLVKNAVTPSANIYSYWVRLQLALVKRDWHDYPNPSEVDFLKIVQPVSSKTRYLGGAVDVVLNARREPYLNAADRIVGYQAGGGPYAVAITIGRTAPSEHFRIVRWWVLYPSGKVAELERRLGGPK